MFPGLRRQDVKDVMFAEMTQGARRHRDGRAWRRGDRGPPRERQMAGRRRTRNMRRRIDATTPMEITGPAAGHPRMQTVGRSDRPARARHDQQLRRRRDTVGHVADLRGELPRLLLRQAAETAIPRRATTSAMACPATGTPGANSTIASTSPRSRTRPTVSAGSSRSIRSIRPRRRRSAPRSAAASTKAPPASSTRTAATWSIPATTSASTMSIASSRSARVDRAQPAGQPRHPRRRRALGRALQRRRHRRLAAAGARAGAADRGERLRQPGRRADRDAPRRRPPRRHQDGPPRGRRGQSGDAARST